MGSFDAATKLHAGLLRTRRALPLLDRFWAPGAAFVVLILLMAGNALLAMHGLTAWAALVAIIGIGIG
jgi:hypothetical protein